jgi:hypothetical protein
MITLTYLEYLLRKRFARNYVNLPIQVSISPIFYEQLFRTKVFCAAFMCLQFGFVIFRRKDFGAKGAHRMLVKLTPDFSRVESRVPYLSLTYLYFLPSEWPVRLV